MPIEIAGRRFIEYPPLGGYSATINTIPDHVIFVAECRSCGIIRQVSRSHLADKGRYGSVSEIGARMRCQCGAKNARLMSGYYASGE
ncbi:hypothetical protein D3C87_1905210 [compost metagenome]